MKLYTDTDEQVHLARDVRIESEIARRGGLNLKRRGKELVGPCPVCGGEDRFAVSITKQVFNCRGCGAKGDVIDLVQHIDGSDFKTAVEMLAGAINGNGKNEQSVKQRKIRAGEFPYPDESGKLSFAVERIEYQDAVGNFIVNGDGKRKKTFLQKRPNPDRPGAWIYNIDGVRILPYRLPELLAAVGNGNQIAIVEGEVKADLLWSWNVPATCSAGGAESAEKRWNAECAEFFRGADVVILPDNDEAGSKYRDSVGAALQGIAASVRVLELPGLPPKGDIKDWKEAGGTVEQLHALIEHNAKPWAPQSEAGTENTTQQQSNVFNAEGLNQMSFDPIKYVVPDYIVEGLTLFAGKPKIGKSWLLLHVAFAVAEGGLTLGNVHCQEGDVLYAALEDNKRRLQSRLTKLFGMSKWPARLNFTCEMPRLTEGGLDFIRGWIEGTKAPRLVIIDTLAMVRMPNRKDQNSYDADYAAVQKLRTLALSHGVAIVLVHHLRKAEADDPFDTISGTLGLTGAPDTIIVIKRDAMGTTLHARGRDLPEIEKAIKFDPGTCTWAVLGEASIIRKSSERAAIVKAMEEAGSEPLSPNQIASACSMKPVNVRNLLARLLDAAVVKKVGYGKYTLVVAAQAAA